MMVTTGIIGSALGLLNGGFLNGLGGLGGGGGVNTVVNTATTGLAAVEAASMIFVNKDQYYQERIADIRSNNAVVADLNQQICALRERAAVSETANAYQNRIVEIGFANVDNRFSTERVITGFEIDAKTCNMIKGQTYVAPSSLAEPYMATDRVISSHPVFPMFNRYGGGCGCEG